jgi:hypothetical protein
MLAGNGFEMIILNDYSNTSTPQRGRNKTGPNMGHEGRKQFLLIRD